MATSKKQKPVVQKIAVEKLLPSPPETPQEDLRDRFAMAALTGILATEINEANSYTDHSGKTRQQWLAVSAYEIADEMMRRRSE